MSKAARKKFLFALCFIAFIAVSLFLIFYSKPEELYLEAQACSEDGEVVDIVIQGKWYRHIKNRTLEAKVQLGDEIYTGGVLVIGRN